MRWSLPAMPRPRVRQVRRVRQEQPALRRAHLAAIGPGSKAAANHENGAEYAKDQGGEIAWLLRLEPVGAVGIRFARRLDRFTFGMRRECRQLVVPFTACRQDGSSLDRRRRNLAQVTCRIVEPLAEIFALDLCRIGSGRLRTIGSIAKQDVVRIVCD